MRAKTIFLLLFIVGCSNPIATAKKTFIPKPILNEIILDFKPITDSIIIKNKICLNKENIENLLYNIKFSRIYFNQQSLNLKLTQDYYSQIISDLGADEK